MDLILAILEESQTEKITLWEGKGGMNMRFVFGTADKQNKNLRTYPLAVFSKGISEAQGKISAGESLYGSADHQAQLGVNDISHRLTKLSMRDKDGIAEAAILKTDRGRNLQAVIAGGGSLGVSMRGRGSIKDNLVQSDWVLEGIDVVLSPSFDNAHISSANVFESEELSPSIAIENIEGRYTMALKAGFKGSLKDYMDGINAKGDDAKLTTLYAGALKAGFKGSYLEFRNSYLGRKA
jgi:hypothetical protein